MATKKHTAGNAPAAAPTATATSIEARLLGATDVNSLAEGLGLPSGEIDAKLEDLFDRLSTTSAVDTILPTLAGYCEAAICRLAAAEGQTALSDARLRTMLEATYEAYALHDLMAQLLEPGCSLEFVEDRVVVRRQLETLLRRLAELNSIILSGLDDDLDDDASLGGRLQGALPAVRPNRQEVAHG